MPVGSAANSGSFKVLTPSDREITLTRLFDAPPQLLFDAMTKPEHVTRWWGQLGDGYPFLKCEIDLRPGGAWHWVTRTPDGGECGFHGVYQEVVAPEHLVYTEIFDPFPDGVSTVTQTIKREGGKSRLTVTALYPSKDVRDMVLKTGMEHGAALSYDRLEERVKELQAAEV